MTSSVSDQEAVHCTYGGDCLVHPEAGGLHNHGTMPAGLWRPRLEALRSAARLIRDRAEAVPPGPWTVTTESAKWGGVVAPATADHPEMEGYGGHLIGESMSEAKRVHVATWHPAVALAVADWLDTGANKYACVDRAPMLRVAYAILGEAVA